MNEQELVERLKERDPEALEEFYRQYRDRVFAVARRIVRDDWDAEEVVQDVLLTMHRKIHLFNGRSAFYSWVYRVTENAARMKVRKYKRYPSPMEDEILFNLFSEDSQERTSGRPEELYTWKQCVETIGDFLETADDVNREIYMRMDFLGYDKEDVAEELDLTIPALKARLHRIRYALRRTLDEQLG